MKIKNFILNIVINLRRSEFFSMVFHTVTYSLKKELSDCESVLDLGCGPDSPVKLCPNIKYSVGVETYKPYLQKSKKNKIHSKYIEKNIFDLDFKEKSFDAVILIEVIEHMKKKDGLKLIKKMEKWARKKIIITTPNGFFPMGEVDKNPFQKHLSGWTVDDFNDVGFKCKGITGAKFMYKDENSVESLGDQEFTFANMRYKPQSLSFIVNSFLQLFVYYLPKYAFELLAVKKIK